MIKEKAVGNGGGVIFASVSSTNLNVQFYCISCHYVPLSKCLPFLSIGKFPIFRSGTDGTCSCVYVSRTLIIDRTMSEPLVLEFENSWFCFRWADGDSPEMGKSCYRFSPSRRVGMARDKTVFLITSLFNLTLATLFNIPTWIFYFRLK